VGAGLSDLVGEEVAELREEADSGAGFNFRQLALSSLDERFEQRLRLVSTAEFLEGRPR